MDWTHLDEHMTLYLNSVNMVKKNPPGSTKYRGFLHYLNNYQFLMKNLNHAVSLHVIFTTAH